VVRGNLLLIFCCVLCLVSLPVLLPTLNHLECREHHFFRVHRFHRSLVRSWESGSPVVTFDSCGYRFGRVDKRTFTTKRPADLKLLTRGVSRRRSESSPGKSRSRPFDDAPLRGAFHVDGNVVYQDLTTAQGKCWL
jgi:hypothetical protein